MTRPTCEDLHFITLPSQVFDVYVVTCENRIWNRILKKNFWKMNSKATRDNSSEPNKGWLLLNKLVKIKARTFLSFRLIFCFWCCNWFFVKLDISWENREIIFQIGKKTWNVCINVLRSKIEFLQFKKIFSRIVLRRYSFQEHQKQKKLFSFYVGVKTWISREGEGIGPNKKI